MIRKIAISLLRWGVASRFRLVAYLCFQFLAKVPLSEFDKERLTTAVMVRNKNARIPLDKRISVRKIHHLSDFAQKKISAVSDRWISGLQRNIISWLHKAADSDSVFSQNCAIWFLILVPNTNDLRTKLRTLALTDTKAEVRMRVSYQRYYFSNRLRAVKGAAAFKGSAYNRPINLEVLRDLSVQNQFVQRTNSRLLKSKNPITVIAENHASLDFLVDKAISENREINIFAFNDRKEEIDRLGLDGKVRLFSLREQFPDISAGSENLHLYCRELAKSVFGLLGNVSGSLDGKILESRDIFGQALEDDAAWKLSLVECIVSAYEKMPENDPVIFACASEDYFPHMLQLLNCDENLHRIHFSFSNLSSAAERSFWKKLRTSDKARAPARSHSGGIDKFRSDLENQLELAHSFGSEAADRAIKAKNLKVQEPIILSMVPASQPYVENAQSVLQAIHASDKPSILLWVGKTILLEKLSLPASTKLVTLDFFGRQLKGGLPGYQPIDIVTLLRENGLLPSYRNFDVSALIERQIFDFFQIKLCMSLAFQSYSQRLVAMTGAKVFATSPGRSWQLRAMALGIRKHTNSKVVDLQVLNVFKHAKYLPPVCDYATVIDSLAYRTYQQDFDVDASKIRLTGTPVNEKLIETISKTNTKQLSVQLGLKPENKNRIMFASQLQPWERVGPAIEALISNTQRPDAPELLIKLHPREKDGRIAQYKRTIQELGNPSKIRLINELSIEQVIALCDTCVTFYSNAGREAAMAGRRVIVALFGDWEPPIRLDLEGLAVRAENSEHLRELLQAPQDETEGGRGADAYFEANPHLLKADSAQRILAVFDEASDAVKNTQFEFGASALRISPSTQTEQLVVIAENQLQFSQCQHLLPADRPLSLYTPSVPPDFVCPDYVELYDNSFDSQGLPLIEQATKRAEHLATEAALCVSKYFENTAISDRVDAQDEAIKLLLRSKFIDQFKNSELFSRGLKSEASHLILLGGSVGFFEMALDANQTGKFKSVTAIEPRNMLKEPWVVNLAGESPFSKTSELYDLDKFRAAVVEESAIWAALEADSLLFDENGPLEDMAMRVPDALVEPIGGWKADLEGGLDRSIVEPTVVATTSWNLKTVAPTLAPVLNILPKAQRVVVFNIHQNSFDDMCLYLANSTASGNLEFLAPANLNSAYPSFPGKTLKILRQDFVKQAKDELIHTQQNPLIVQNAIKILDRFVGKELWQILGWDAKCREYLVAIDSVSLACPGRQWHAQVAHSVAEENQRNSITLQNAYMTASYTYSKPSGKCITAIDSWQRDIFINDFGIAPDSIVVTGSPRFDYLKSLQTLESGESKSKIGISRQKSVIMFATQPGYEDITDHVMTGFKTLMRELSNKIEMHPIIKLHPRTSEQEVARVTDQAGETISVFLDEPIGDVLQATDIVITAFSNVGMEGAVMGKPVIVAKMGHEKLPLPLDELGLGIAVNTANELVSAIHQFLTNDAVCGEVKSRQDEYFSQNPTFRTGNSAQIVANLVLGV